MWLAFKSIPDFDFFMMFASCGSYATCANFLSLTLCGFRFHWVFRLEAIRTPLASAILRLSIALYVFTYLRIYVFAQSGSFDGKTERRKDGKTERRKDRKTPGYKGTRKLIDGLTQ